MGRYLSAVFLVLCLFISPLQASAAGLTQSQIQAVLGLIAAFGGDEQTLANAAKALESSDALPKKEKKGECQTMSVTTDKDDGKFLSSIHPSVKIEVNIASCTELESPSISVVFPPKKGERAQEILIPVDLKKIRKIKGVWESTTFYTLNRAELANKKFGTQNLEFSYEDAEAKLSVRVGI